MKPTAQNNVVYDKPPLKAGNKRIINTKGVFRDNSLLTLSSICLGLMLLNRIISRKKFELPKKPRPYTCSINGVTVSWLGHASILINFFGKVILIDPVLESRLGVTLPGNLNIGPKRYLAPALTVNELGPVDLLLMSHGHVDHFDYPTLRKLQSINTTAITAKNTCFLWDGLVYQDVREIWWGEALNIDGITIKAIQGRHRAARLPWLTDMTANSYLISYGGVNIFFAGDTGYTPIIREQLRGIPVDILIVGIANYLPTSLQKDHCSPEQAWQMAKEIGAARIIPMHWGTFKLSEEPMEEPLPRFLHAAGSERGRIIIPIIERE